MTRKAKKNKYLDRLSEYLSNELKVDIEDVFTYMGFNEKSLEGKRGFPTSRTDTKFIQRPFRWSEAAMLKLGFNIPNEYLVIDKDDEIKWSDKNPSPKYKHFLRKHEIESALITDWSPQNTILDIVDLDYSHDKVGERKRFSDMYIEVVLPFVKSSDHSIFVSEFLNKGTKAKRKMHLNAYQDAHEVIFEEGIENKINTIPDFRYSRVMTKHFSKEANTPELKIREVIMECSVTTFKHMVRCLYRFGNEKIGVKSINDKGKVEEKTVGRVRFCAAPSNRNAHISIIDSNILFDETYKFIRDDNDLIQVPDTLRVEKCTPSEKLRKLADKYEFEMENAFIENFCITNKNIRLHSDAALSMARTASTVIGVKSVQEYDMDEKIEFLDKYFKALL